MLDLQGQHLIYYINNSLCYVRKQIFTVQYLFKTFQLNFYIEVSTRRRIIRIMVKQGHCALSFMRANEYAATAICASLYSFANYNVIFFGVRSRQAPKTRIRLLHLCDCEYQFTRQLTSTVNDAVYQSDSSSIYPRAVQSRKLIPHASW